MKTSVSPHMVAVLLFSTIAPLSAQNLPGNSRGQDPAERLFATSAPTGKFDLPTAVKAQGELPPVKAIYAAQDQVTLDSRAGDRQKVESVVDLGVLRDPSPYRKVMVSTAGQPYETAADSLQNGLALISAVYRESGTKAESPESADCVAIALSVEQRVKLDASKVLEIVESEVAANPSCACEIVKTAIKASEADVALVVSIVETTIHAVPESMRIVSQCAIAAMPESIAEVQALLSRLDPNSGDSDAYSSKSAKSAKSAKVASIVAPKETGNPLDLPPAYPPIIPPIFPYPVTNVNP